MFVGEHGAKCDGELLQAVHLGQRRAAHAGGADHLETQPDHRILQSQVSSRHLLIESTATSVAVIFYQQN